MKITNKMDGDVLASQLAKQVCSCHNDKAIIIAQKEFSVKDEARQSAETYWMMGWTWDEIESVLEDSNYPTAIINSAIKDAKEYARKILNEGPFAVLSTGQLIKLKNGLSGVLVQKASDLIIVNIKDIGNVQVTADQIDSDATGNLREAFMLRKQANNMIVKLSVDDLFDISVDQDTDDTFFSSVKKALATLESLAQETKEITKEAANLHNEWVEREGTWEPQSEAEKEFAQYVYVMLGGESQLNDEINTLFYHKLGSMLTKLYNVINAGAEINNSDVTEFIETTFPKIATKIESHLYEVNQKNTQIREYVQSFLKFSDVKTATWQRDAVNWAKNSWETTKQFIEDWENIIIPAIDTGINDISAFLLKVNNKNIAKSIKSALYKLSI